MFNFLKKKNKVVTRFAPSPTGFLHVGGARSALFNYIYAKQNDGKVILRVEDTDKERSKPEFTEGIIKGFKWLGLEFDEFHLQSDNVSIHRKYIEKMIAENKAYISKEEVKEEGQRSEVIRFRNPNKKVVVEDLIRGNVEFDTTELGDFIIAKDLNEPIFHLSNVVDDLEMGITHVIRGEEHLSNTPRQILIWEAITDKPRMKYAHIPLILSETREKLSKRKHGEIVSIEYYQKMGYLPEAMINFLALLGWNPGDNTEIMSLDEIIKRFDISKVQKGGAIFNAEKLKWTNKEYIKKIDDKVFTKMIFDFAPDLSKISKDIFERLAPTLKERISTFGEINEMFGAGEFDYYLGVPKFNPELLLWKKNPSTENVKKHLTFAIGALDSVSDWTIDNIKNSLWKYAEENGRGDVLWPLRVTLSGKEKSPDPFTLAYILGKDESLTRIKSIISKL